MLIKWDPEQKMDEIMLSCLNTKYFSEFKGQHLN